MLHRPFALALLAALPAAAPAQKGLDTLRTKEAIVKANTTRKIAEAVGQRIDNFCAAFQAFYDELGLEKKADNKLAARLFNTQDEFEQHYRRTNADEDPPKAYFSSSLNAIVLYNDEADITLRQTLFHESSHQYLSRYTSDAPRWLNEGLAEYFEGWRMGSDGSLLEKRVNLYDLKLLQDCQKAGKGIQPRTLLGLDNQQFYDFKKNHPELHPYLHYVTAWSIVYFSLVLSGVPEDRQRLVSFFKDLNDKGPRASFVVEDWDAFEDRWKQAILGLEAKPVDVVDHILLADGHLQSREWREAAALYQAAYEKDPKAPGALYRLGSCMMRIGKYDEAMKWLAKARESEPDNPSVPYLMARIALGIGQKDAKGDPVAALAFAEAASKLAGGESPGYLELVARCQAKAGDTAGAGKTVKRILKLVEEDADKAYYEKLEKDLKGK